MKLVNNAIDTGQFDIIVVPFNAQAQPVGEVAGLLSGFLGLVVTYVATFPISYHSWDKVPNSYKESCFNSIKAMSEKNRENRSKLKMPHTCGSKSMARKKQEMELASGKPVSRGALFVATHKRKDGSYVNDNAKIVSVSRIPLNGEMDSLGQVLGKESLGRVRGLGFGPSPTQVFGHATTRLGRIPLNGSSDHAGDVALQEIARLKLQLEANKSQTKSFMTFVLRNLVLESVPPEFADLINPQVSDAKSAEPSSMGYQSSQA
ncbi:hypothetical protein G2W53_014730 [Senna tora]|uniref:Uncharacterized protein n=1 Tax=Senna tora TaxID=362788 RepID=A0A835C8J9_9FABA|nr:hypothetical protein G2W53_014730 [Senna tora]